MWCCCHGNRNNSVKKALGGNSGILWQMPTAVKYFSVRNTEAGCLLPSCLLSLSLSLHIFLLSLHVHVLSPKS